MTATAWALLGGGIAIGCEYLYRTLTGAWWHYLWAWIPLQVAVGYCVYRLVTVPGTSLISAFVVWSFSTIALRVFVSIVLLGDAVKPSTWVALGLVVLARIVQTTWR